MTNRTKTVHETAANKARRATNGVKAIVDYGQIISDGLNCRYSLARNPADDRCYCPVCHTKRIDALGEQVARVASAVHAKDMAIDDMFGVVQSMQDKLNYYAWGTVMACVIALASLWVALAR